MKQTQNTKSQKQLPNVFYKKDAGGDVRSDLNVIAASIYPQYGQHQQKRGLSESPTRANGGQQKIPRPNYYNEAIELELIIFKKEIEEKFARSIVN